jgi:DNA-binding protein YbaB
MINFPNLAGIHGAAGRGNLQDTLKAIGVNTDALQNAVNSKGVGDLAGYQRSLFEAFNGVDATALQGAMAKPFAGQAPDVAQNAVYKRRSTGVGILGHLAGIAGGFALGGPIGALAGLGISSLVGHIKGKVTESRMMSDPTFRAQMEAQHGGRFIPDGRNDGKLTFAQPNFGLPRVGLNPGVLGGLGGAGLGMAGLGMGGMMAGSAIGGLARMQNGIAGQLGRMTGMQFDPTMGLLGTPRGGRNTAMLGAGATFEDLVAAFMMDTIEKSQKEIEHKMRQLEMSNNSGGMGFRSMLGGLGGAIGGIGGALLGGPAGAMIGGSLGNGLMGGGATAGADSRQMMMEQLKNLMNKLQQMQQAMSNVLNTMHSGAMNSVRNIRA